MNARTTSMLLAIALCGCATAASPIRPSARASSKQGREAATSPTWASTVGRAAPRLPPPSREVRVADGGPPTSFALEGRSDEVWRAWRAALEAAGYRVAALLRDEEHAVVAELEGPNGGRGNVSLIDGFGAVRGALDWVAAPVTMTLATACVAPPSADYVVEVVSREANPPPDREAPTAVRHGLRTQLLDLDGDGRLDRVVPTVPPATCPHDVRYTLYVMRGACGHEVGTIVGAPEAVGLATPGHLRPLRVVRRWAAITDASLPPGPHNVATLHTETTLYTATGGAYVAGTPSLRSGVCHHCGMSRCRVLSGP